MRNCAGTPGKLPPNVWLGGRVPLRAKSVIETLKQEVVYAHRMQKWDEGMEAADLLAEWTLDFVNWWNANVSVRQSAGGGKRTVSNADLRSTLSMAEAEAETWIKQQQVARLARRLPAAK